MDLDFKVEKVNALSKELEEAEAVGGIRGSEEEFSSLKRQKHELELKSKDQEEELDDLAGQVQMLELAKMVLMDQLEGETKDKLTKEMKNTLEKRLFETFLILGEVSLENENYPQAVDDLTICLEKQKVKL